MPRMASCTALAGFVVLALRFDGPSELPPAQRSVMVQEADALWRPHGVAVVDAACFDRAIRLTVRIQPGAKRIAREGARRLGAIDFDEHNEPATTVMLDARGILETISRVRQAGRPIDQWPAAFGNHAAGRALGRVLAHEIGHYLLASRQHSSAGLMRAAFRADELAAPDRRPFGLPALYLERLAVCLARLTQSMTAAANEP
jgi:hypothetical protein